MTNAALAAAFFHRFSAATDREPDTVVCMILVRGCVAAGRDNDTSGPQL
jgi:hypothetical protein